MYFVATACISGCKLTFIAAASRSEGCFYTILIEFAWLWLAVPIIHGFHSKRKTPKVTMKPNNWLMPLLSPLNWTHCYTTSKNISNYYRKCVFKITYTLPTCTTYSSFMFLALTLSLATVFYIQSKLNDESLFEEIHGRTQMSWFRCKTRYASDSLTVEILLSSCCQILYEKLQVNCPCPLAQQAKKVAHLHDCNINHCFRHSMWTTLWHLQQSYNQLKEALFQFLFQAWGTQRLSKG